MRDSTYIYALVCPLASESRYVGKSDDPFRRLTEHIDAARNGLRADDDKAAWINGLAARGLKPGVVVLEVVAPADQWQQAELAWIKRLLEDGCSLFNRHASPRPRKVMPVNLPKTAGEYRRWWAENTNTPYGHCWCGCGQRTTLAPKTNRARCKFQGEPHRYCKGHGHGNVNEPSATRYREEDRGYETPCWVWLGGRGAGGYGAYRERGTDKKRPAHVIFYEREHGPLPPGMTLDHLCRVRPCLRPSHLEPATFTENVRRRSNTKFSPETIRTIRAAMDRSPADLAREHGTTPRYVRAIRSGERWAGV